jgi:hypothetical protein
MRKVKNLFLSPNDEKKLKNFVHYSQVNAYFECLKSHSI